MITVFVGLAGALFFGAGDFLGGLAAKRISALRVTAVAAAVGMVVLLVVISFTGGVWSAEAIWLGALSGVSAAVAISLLYACLAIGPMSILSPLTAVVSAVVPMTADLLRGERLPSIGYAAVAIALVAIVLVGFVPDKTAVRPSLRALLMAVGSGSAIGVFLIIIDLTPDDSGLVPLVFNRAVNAAIMFAAIGVLFLLARRRSALSAVPVRSEADAEADAAAVVGGSGPAGMSGWRAGLMLAVLCGTVDAIGNALLLLGLRLGDLTVISVLTALYPAGTIILAAAVLRERIAKVQGVGLVLAVAAGAMLALA